MSTPNHLDLLRSPFLKGKVLINYLTAGFPQKSSTVDLLLKLEKLGSDIIELGVPFSDPVADGPLIKMANDIALRQGITLVDIFKMVREARDRGLKAPIILMGYYNVFYQYGLEKLMVSSQENGVNGFIIVDLQPDLATKYVRLCHQYNMGLVPLISMTSSRERILQLVKYANCFIYCVAVKGITGGREALDHNLIPLITSVKLLTRTPIAVGFGISKAIHAKTIWEKAEGVIMGSKIIENIQNENLVEFLKPFLETKSSFSPSETNSIKFSSLRDPASGFVNNHNNINQYLPEILVAAHQELEMAFKNNIKDPSFQSEFKELLKNYVGRPSPLYRAKNLTTLVGGASIWFKREDLNHTGSHKINNALGQALLAKRMGKTKVIAETGAGQHGIATATVCCLLNLKCKIYMGAKDVGRQIKNVEKIKLLGAEIVVVEEGTRTLRDAINKALQDWISESDTCYYLVGSAIGAHPYPEIVEYFQAIIGRETKKQFYELNKCLPDYIIACVGGGSNAIGIFNEFLDDREVKLIGVEAGGISAWSEKTAASINHGKIGVLHGTKTYLIQDKEGQIKDTHSISAGLDYPGIGPVHTQLHHTSRATYVTCYDRDAVNAFKLLVKTEGIIPALETSHALAYAIVLAKKCCSSSNIIVNLSGRGDKDIETVTNFSQL